MAELIKAEEEEAKALKQSVALAPIQTEYMQLSYAKAADIEKLITQNKSASGSGSSNGTSNNDDRESLLSSRGSISIDARTNTIIVNDTQPFIDKIRNMVDLLDVQVKQVMVEARIVRATTDFTKEMGVKWGILSQGITNNNHLLVGSDTTLWDLRDPQESDLGGFTYDIQRPDNLNVDLG